jgi:hypothetical protein
LRGERDKGKGRWKEGGEKMYKSRGMRGERGRAKDF